MNDSSLTGAPDGPRAKSLFHYVLVTFGAPGRWPVWVVYLLGGLLAAGVTGLWVSRGHDANEWPIIFVLALAFFGSDRQLLASLPERQLSFAPWTEQIAALALARALAAGLLGFLIPWLGWWPAFYVNAALQLAGTIALYRGAILEPGRLSLTELAITTDRLPAGSPPLRFLHISDIHVERIGRREARLLELVRDTKADFIFMTGDYVNLSNNTDPATHDQVRQLLAAFPTRGVYAVMGSPAVDRPGAVAPLFDGGPARLLRDEAVELEGSDGQTVTVIGLDCQHDIDADSAVLDSVLAMATSAGPRILLYHSPELMTEAIERGIDVYLCGHTHGGQVRLPIIGAVLTSSELGRRYVMGHYHEGRTHLYVSRGIGFEGLGAPRVRFLCPPEVTLVTLTGTGLRDEDFPADR